MSSYDFSKVSVLVADDNDHMRKVIRGIMDAIGVKSLYEARNGEEALATLRAVSPDLCLIDYKMPLLDGLTFTRHVRKGQDIPNKFVPIILITGYAQAEDVHFARDAGINEMLAKPISVAGMASRLGAVIEKPRSFIKTKTYLGPDRRRKSEPFEGQGKRAADRGAKK